jgi:hypothetical protein
VSFDAESEDDGMRFTSVVAGPWNRRRCRAMPRFEWRQHFPTFNHSRVISYR